jgi:predicted phosphohydrolase
MEKAPYLWITDPHLTPLTRRKMLNAILDRAPVGVFLTGDVSTCSQTFLGELDFLGERIGRPLFFVYGNHDLWFSDRASVENEIRALCRKHKNLIWMNESGIVPLNESSCVIGHNGWYDGRNGNSDYIRYTADWFLIKDFRQLPTMPDRIDLFRKWADESAEKLSAQLEEAVKTYKTVWLLSHFPMWKEAHRASAFLEQFWASYNCNLVLGQALEKVMANYKKRHLICLTGHTHSPVHIFVSRGIECRVGRAKYFGGEGEMELLYI